MTDLTLKSGGNLFRNRWNPDTKQYDSTDVTDNAVQYLHSPCSLDADVTLRDVFLLLNRELEVYDLFFGRYCLTKTVVENGLTPPVAPSDIEFLELYWFLEIDKDYENDDKKTIYSFDFPRFHGVSIVKEDYKEEGSGFEYKKGERIEWALDLSLPCDLAGLPLKLADTTSLVEGSDVKKFTSPTYTLFNILYGVVWELCFIGGPEDIVAMRDSLNEQVEEIKSGRAKTVPWEEVKKSLEMDDDLHD